MEKKINPKNQWLSTKTLTFDSHQSKVRRALLHAAMAQAGKGSFSFHHIVSKVTLSINI